MPKAASSSSSSSAAATTEDFNGQKSLKDILFTALNVQEDLVINQKQSISISLKDANIFRAINQIQTYTDGSLKVIIEPKGDTPFIIFEISGGTIICELKNCKLMFIDNYCGKYNRSRTKVSRIYKRVEKRLLTIK